MQAIFVDSPGKDSVLRIGETEAPKPTSEEILIRVRATAVNRADLMQRRGVYPPPPGASPILGLECAGEVIAVGENVSGWRPGDRAMALLPGGGYATEAVVDAGSAIPIPATMSYSEAGAFPETFLTAYLNIFGLGKALKGESVLVHGGGSGVGTAAISLCREAGIKVFVTAGSEAKCHRCLEHGAEGAFNYRTENFTDSIHKATDNSGVDVILDCVGGSYLASNLACLTTEGRLIVIGLIGGARAELNLATLMLKRAKVMGSTLRPRSTSEKAAIVEAFLDQFGEALQSGRLRPIIDKEFPLAEAADAHRLVQASEHFGKVALRV